MTTDANKNRDTGDNQEQESKEIQSRDGDTNENDHLGDNGDAAAIAKKRKKIQRLVRILLFLPYFLGMVWTCLHPIVSVITGELKCRGWYLDEHSIETRFTIGQNPQMVPAHLQHLRVAPLRSKQNQNEGNRDAAVDDERVLYSLCDFFAAEGDPGFNPHNLICHKHGDYFEMALIKPLSNAIDVSEEAVVLIVPRPDEVYRTRNNEEGGTIDWDSSIFHQAMLRSIQHLANPVETPWLAKAVIVVTPTLNSSGDKKNSSLAQTVSLFLDAHSGQQTISQDYQRNRHGPKHEETIPLLPPRLSGAILRNLVVLEVFDDSSQRSTSNARKPTNTDLSILPQGRRGVLPNADLVFLVGMLMEKTIAYKSSMTKTFLTHPYTQDSKKAESWVNRWIDESDFFAGNHQWSRKAKSWAKGMIDLVLFAKTLAIGPTPPHAAALERGIDSLTVRSSFEGTFKRDPSVELVQYSEYILRSLGNLHERLHHSFTLYLLPTPKSFVSHIEYLLPNILILLPLAVRVFGILLPSMTRGLDLTAVAGVLLVVFVVLVAMFLATEALGEGEDFTKTMTTALVLLYTGVAIYWVKNILKRHRESNAHGPNEKEKIHDCINPETRQTVLTLQFVTCALAVYILVPVAFAHASLSYLPSVLWTPLLAFPDYVSLATKKKKSITSKSPLHRHIVVAVLCLLVVITAPSCYLVPEVISSYTPFVTYVYVPIHVLFFLLVTSVLVSG